MKKVASYILDFVKEEYKMILFCVFLFIVCEIPLNYYIIIGGGISDISSRIEVEDGYQGKGSFNLSYVSELPGTVLSYLLSYIIPTWDVEDANLYKYSKEESIEDIEFRSDLDLQSANSTAIYWAYSLANKSLKEEDSHIYVISSFHSDLKVGDEILHMNNQHFDNVDLYREYLQTLENGQEIVVRVIRHKKEIDVPVTLYEEDGRLLLGVLLQMVSDYETDPNVHIKFRRAESGPSAGVITTLEIYNQLVKKDITHGLKIAGTGTIEMDGSVGEIGGVEHKLLGAASDKADIFLVPSGQNYRDALQYKKDKKLKIKLIEISSIQDALEKLEKLS